VEATAQHFVDLREGSVDLADAHLIRAVISVDLISSAPSECVAGSPTWSVSAAPKRGIIMPQVTLEATRCDAPRLNMQKNLI
jgi:hypothetical protein